MGKEVSYEIHVTGDKSIIENAKKLGWKTIEIDLIRPDMSVLRREYMTSEVRKYTNIYKAIIDAAILCDDLLKMKTEVYRLKIEAPPLPMFFPFAKYVEAHFKTQNTNYPTSKNSKKDILLATDREYNPERYCTFLEKHVGKELEICVYDNNIKEDQDWLSLWIK